MGMMNKIGVSPMVMIKGQTGIYFKFADCLSKNGGAVELYFKPKFIDAAYKETDDSTPTITWLETNILWVGDESFPEFENGWEPIRGGKYITKGGKHLTGVLIGKALVPMGEFNKSVPLMYEWMAKNANQFDKFLKTSLLNQVHGTVYMPLKTIFEYMLEQVSNDNAPVPEFKVFLNNGYSKYQKELSKSLKDKYLEHDDDEDGE